MPSKPRSLAVKARGERTGGIPLGSRAGAGAGRLEEDAAEGAAVKRARALRAEGRSLRGIAAAAALEAGVFGRAGPGGPRTRMPGWSSVHYDNGTTNALVY
jgi:hypothetical protein